MTDEFEFFSNDFNNWNYNEFLIKPGVDLFNNNETNLDPFGCNFMKFYNVV